jgi:hypothetical protein
MKNIFMAMIACLVLNFAPAQLKTPAPSPTQSIKQDFALSTIEISYSRPGVKGRKIFGDLVPFGSVWRTGANSATTIVFGDTVIINKTKVAPGKYGLLTIPDRKKWTFIISKQTDVTNPADYKQDQDLVRANADAESIDDPVESFTINIVNIKPTSCELQLVWDKTSVSLPITVDIDNRIMGQIDQLINKDNRPYFSAAMYYMDNGKDLNQALQWFNKAVELQPRAYFVIYQQANCLAKLGKKDEARAAALKSKSLAAEQNNNDYVRLNDKLLAELEK